MTNTPYAALLIPTDTPKLPSVVLGTVPTVHSFDTPHIVYLGDEAKAIKFEIDPSVARYIVHPSGVVDAEY